MLVHYPAPPAFGPRRQRDGPLESMTPAENIPPAAAQRIVDLEERLTFQQRQIDQLHAVALDHRRELDVLTAELNRLRTALDRVSDASLGDDLPHEKPPHY
jgi:uncharacterized coiled-coil protein SlyX